MARIRASEVLKVIGKFVDAEKLRDIEAFLRARRADAVACCPACGGRAMGADYCCGSCSQVKAKEERRFWAYSKELDNGLEGRPPVSRPKGEPSRIPQSPAPSRDPLPLLWWGVVVDALEPLMHSDGFAKRRRTIYLRAATINEARSSTRIQVGAYPLKVEQLDDDAVPIAERAVAEDWSPWVLRASSPVMMR